jgi:hypothetical protein
MRETQARIDSFSGSTRLIAFRELVPGAARLDSSAVYWLSLGCGKDRLT